MPSRYSVKVRGRSVPATAFSLTVCRAFLSRIFLQLRAPIFAFYVQRTTTPTPTFSRAIDLAVFKNVYRFPLLKLNTLSNMNHFHSFLQPPPEAAELGPWRLCDSPLVSFRLVYQTQVNMFIPLVMCATKFLCNGPEVMLRGAMPAPAALRYRAILGRLGS
ncbi:hypothetical protein EW145_g7159 [Phellinidium pouzarii]|uniref:Uncharacterized protein n=1 Tax=Phellinidium pouzarii TaxID=167371 RepID=A0A4S4KSR2_9AGAM|nr:hypothetical protein EW145_g7159 [Phellinidium pouzarii]